MSRAGRSRGPSQDELVAGLRVLSPASATEVADWLGHPTDAVRRDLTRLRRNGIVRTDASTKGTEPLYRLRPDLA